MSNQENILRIAILVIALLSFIAASYKAGHVIWYSNAWWKQDKNYLTVDKSKLGIFALSVIIVFGLSIIIINHMSINANDKLPYAILNTICITFALMYWILFKKNKHSKSKLNKNETGYNRDKSWTNGRE